MTNIKNKFIFFQDLILCDVGQGHWYNQHQETVLVPPWSKLKSLDLSHNHISNIEQSVVSNIYFFYNYFFQ